MIVVTETASLDEAVTALQEGASDFLIKSLLNEDILRVSVQRAMERRNLRLENRHYREMLEQTNERLQHSLQLLEHDQPTVLVHSMRSDLGRFVALHGADVVVRGGRNLPPPTPDDGQRVRPDVLIDIDEADDWTDWVRRER